MQVSYPLPAGNRHIQIFQPSSMCVETLFQKKVGYLSIISAGEEYPS